MCQSTYSVGRLGIGMDFPLHFSDQLREHLRALRKARGLTQTDLGRLLGVGQARIAEIEANPGVVGLDQLMKLLSALDASLILRDDTAAPASRPALPPAGAPFVAEPPAPSLGGLTIRPKKGSW